MKREYLKDEALEVYDKMCEHMKNLVDFCVLNEVYYGGCGDCGSPWLGCKLCDSTVDNAHYLFDAFYGGMSNPVE